MSEAKRPVRSFVRRQGRITPAQQRALTNLWPRFGLAYEGTPWPLAELFGRQAPLVVEIGFGNGEALVADAARHAENNYLGIDVHRPGAGRLLRALASQELDHVRVIVHDAVEVLAKALAPDSVAEVRLFFPDPWPKKRHHKRRIIQPDFIDLVAGRLEKGGVFHLATDWEPYAEQMLELLEQNKRLKNRAGRGQFSADRGARIVTRFEQRGIKKGHQVRDLIYQRC